jgi:hypothetical protein
MRNRSYIGDGVYASFDSGRCSVLIELENGRPIELKSDTFHALVEFVHKQKVNFNPHVQLIEVPNQCFKEVVSELRELESVAARGGTKLQ